MSVALLWVVSPNTEISNFYRFVDSVRYGNRLLDSTRLMQRDRSWSKAKKFSTYIKHSCAAGPDLESGSNFPVLSSLVVNPSEETNQTVTTSVQKVSNVVQKQAALVTKQLRSSEYLDVKPDIVLPGTLSLLSEAYDRCGQVCAEYAKTFYLG